MAKRKKQDREGIASVFFLFAVIAIIYNNWIWAIAFVAAIGLILFLVWLFRRKKRKSRKVSLAKIQEVDQFDGIQFEYWCANLLGHFGYSKITVTKASGDQGVDIVAVKDGVRYAIQCKRYASKLSNKCVQEVYAGMAMYNCSVGMVMTNNYFTDAAIHLAQKTGTILVDRNNLFSMLQKVEEAEKS